MPNNSRSELGLFLEKLRGKKSLRMVAEQSGLSHAYIRDLELGMNRKTKAPINPTPETLKRLSEAYNFPYEELMKKAGYIEEEQETDEKSPAQKLIGYLEMGIPVEEIVKLMNFTVDGMSLTDEEATEFVEFVRVKRLMKKQQAVSRGEER